MRSAICSIAVVLSRGIMRSPLLLCLLSFVDFAVTARLVGKTNSPPIAQVRNGTLAGYNVPAYGQDFFLGIPYAQAPVGQLRLANPQSLNGTFQGGKQDATEYYPSCVGYGTDDDGYPVSEDCLALNVIRPEGTEASERLPVAVWIHGGGDSEGGSRDERYNLSFIVQNSAEMGKPIIAASLNYRLAQWGFLAGDEIQEAGVANLGLKDQRLALHWIHENIGAFGGDPAKVTIWGESSGGGSVVYHSILYGGRDDHLYRGVISESYFANNNEANATAYNEWYAEVVTAAGCAAGPGSLECLRNAPFATLNTAFSATLGSSPGPGPVLDGALLTELTSEALGCGRFVRAPILIGGKRADRRRGRCTDRVPANFDEGTAFAVSGINTDEQFDATVAALGPDTGAVAEIAELYPDIPALGIPGTERGRPPANESSLGSQWKRSGAQSQSRVQLVQLTREQRRSLATT